MTSKIINTKDYNIYFGGNSLTEFEKFIFKEINNKQKLFFLVDENTKNHCLSVLLRKNKIFENAGIINIKSGEENKNLNTVNLIWEQLAEQNAERSSILINFGGGVISDIGGFAASTFKRGIRFINIPTTLLAMVDATIGGKTGIDLQNLKNLVGLFSNPIAVFVFPGFLKTLEKRQITAGLAEMIKHGLISDKNYFEKLKSCRINNIDAIEKAILSSIKIKNKITEIDPFEKGERKKLNFGHTIGHALESWSLKNETSPLLHGEAVAIGMICESYISEKISTLSKSELDEITNYLLSVFPHFKIKKNHIHEIVKIIYHDKKNNAGKFNFSLLKSIGNAEINHDCEINIIEDSIKYYLDKISSDR